MFGFRGNGTRVLSAGVGGLVGSLSVSCIMFKRSLGAGELLVYV